MSATTDDADKVAPWTRPPGVHKAVTDDDIQAAQAARERGYGYTHDARGRRMKVYPEQGRQQPDDDPTTWVGYRTWRCDHCTFPVADDTGWVYADRGDVGRPWIATHAACGEYVTRYSARVQDARFADQIERLRLWFASGLTDYPSPEQAFDHLRRTAP